MGMYTELIFQGKTIAQLPDDIKNLFTYFFTDDNGDIPNKSDIPAHPLFKCPRWRHIGHMSSYTFIPFPLRHMESHIIGESSHVFLRSDLKNYDDEIVLFLDWIDPYMQIYYGWHWYEEDDLPTVFMKER